MENILARIKGVDTSGGISGYARNAMAWAVEQGIVNGSGGKLDSPAQRRPR